MRLAIAVIVSLVSGFGVILSGCSAPGTPAHTTLDDPPGITAQRINGPGPRYDNGEPGAKPGDTIVR